MQTQNRNRLDVFDIAKGIGIISIIIGHLGIAKINRIVFTYHVPLFFIISGYFFRSVDVKSLIIKKAKQLLLPYIITCIFICVGSVFFCICSGKPWMGELKSWVVASLYGAGDSWEEPFKIRAIGAIWFLLALFWGFLIANLCISKVKTDIVMAIALAYLGIITSDMIWLPFSIQAGCTASLYILLGYFARKFELFPPQKGIHLFMAFLVWVCSIWKFQGFWLVHNYFGNGFLDFLGSLCAVYIIIYLSTYIKSFCRKTSCILKFFGENSLYILCLHLFELNLFPWFQIRQSLDYIGIQGIPKTLAIIVLKLFFSSICTIIIKRGTYIVHSYSHL